jgi:hypothetical protein
MKKVTEAYNPKAQISVFYSGFVQNKFGLLVL